MRRLGYLIQLRVMHLPQYLLRGGQVIERGLHVIRIVVLQSLLLLSTISTHQECYHSIRIGRIKDASRRADHERGHRAGETCTLLRGRAVVVSIEEPRVEAVARAHGPNRLYRE